MDKNALLSYNSTMEQLFDTLKQTPVAYVTRDFERALGLPLNTQGYFIISNNTGFAKKIARGRKNVLLINANKQLDTYELLEHEKTKKFLKKNKIDNIVVFKNTKQIEKTCLNKKWNLLNPSASLASKVEEKIQGTLWLGSLTKYLPPYKIILGQDLEWPGRKFIVQFNRAHTGNGTILINSEEDLKEIKEKFPKREIRITKFIDGPMVTNNNVVWGEKILIGNVSYQITGLKPFTDRPFATVGNDWALPHKIMSNPQKKRYVKIAESIGNKLASEGWKGEFGIDVIVDKETGKLYLIEINARQPASTSCESWLQREVRSTSEDDTEHANKLTTFEAHLLALLEDPYKDQNLIRIKNGAQIVQKILQTGSETKKNLLEKDIVKFSKLGWRVLSYDNDELEKDWIRMQVQQGIMADDGIFNELGSTATLFSLSALYNSRWGAKRAGIVITKNEKILLFKRQRFGSNFYIVPGGRQDNLKDNLKKTAIRELNEELGLEVVLGNAKPIKLKSLDREECYFFAKSFSGEPRLGGEELERNKADNTYVFEWVDIKKLDKINLLPVELKEKLIKILK